MKNKKYFIPFIVLMIASLACGGLTTATPAVSTPVITAATAASSGQSMPPANQPAASPNSPREELYANANNMKLDITYCTVDGVELKMDLYFPKTLNGATPIVVYVHGGGWSSGDKASGAGEVDAPALLEAGFIVGAVNYRLAPQYKMPAMIEDVKCSIRFLRAHAAEYNINPDKIGVWGGSAGGHLVNMLGTSDASAGFDVGEYLDQSSRVQAVADMFGPADLTVEFAGGYKNLKESVFGGVDAAKVSPVTYITPDDPPFLILQGDQDQLVPLSQSQELYDKLTAAGVPAELVIVKNAGHSFVPANNAPIDPSRGQITQMVVEFFTKKLK